MVWIVRSEVIIFWEGVFSAAKLLVSGRVAFRMSFHQEDLHPFCPPSASPKDPNVGEQVQPAIFSKQCLDNNTYLIWLLLHVVQVRSLLCYCNIELLTNCWYLYVVRHGGVFQVFQEFALGSCA